MRTWVDRADRIVIAESPSGASWRLVRLWPAASIVLLVVVMVSAALFGREAGASDAAIAPSVSTRLLSIANQDAAGCGGKAVHVQVARSTRDTATMVTMQDVGLVGDHRAVWAMLITGGTYSCATTGPPGALQGPATHELLEIVDAATFEPTDGGSGQNDSLRGLHPIITLR